jgi:hypothetical protein
LAEHRPEVLRPEHDEHAEGLERDDEAVGRDEDRREIGARKHEVALGGGRPADPREHRLHDVAVIADDFYRARGGSHLRGREHHPVAAGR